MKHSITETWSTGVPVLTLAYSQKARNLNAEIYNSDRYFEDIAHATVDDIVAKLLALADDLDTVRKKTAQGVRRMLQHTDAMFARQALLA